MQYIIRAGILFFVCADECQVLDASDIPGVREVQIAIWILFLIQGRESAGRQHYLYEFVIFGTGACAPVNSVRLSMGRHLVHPGLQSR